MFADMHSSLEQAMADREALEIRLNESSPGDNTRKVYCVLYDILLTIVYFRLIS